MSNPRSLLFGVLSIQKTRFSKIEKILNPDQDCSFMGALCSFAHYRHTKEWEQFRLAKDELQQRVLHIEHNTKEAKTSRKFLFDFYAFHSWRTISIDDRLHMWSVRPYDKPALADEPRTGVYWGCFIEKVRH